MTNTVQRKCKDNGRAPSMAACSLVVLSSQLFVPLIHPASLLASCTLYTHFLLLWCCELNPGPRTYEASAPY